MGILASIVNRLNPRDGRGRLRRYDFTLRRERFCCGVSWFFDFYLPEWELYFYWHHLPDREPEPIQVYFYDGALNIESGREQIKFGYNDRDH